MAPSKGERMENSEINVQNQAQDSSINDDSLTDNKMHSILEEEKQETSRDQEPPQSPGHQDNLNDQPAQEPDAAQPAQDEGIIDLSRFQDRQSTWKQSTLKPVLADYGLPHSCSASDHNPVQKNKKKPEKKNVSFDEDHESERKNARKQRHLQVYEDIHTLRDGFYRLYMEKLRSKVEAQREEIRKKSEAFHGRLQAKEEQERRDSHRVKKRINKVTVKHDDDFVRNVPKSDHYKIIALQNKLKSEGMLKTQEELDDFWTDVRNPEMLKKYLLIYKPLPSDPSSKTLSLTTNSQYVSQQDLQTRSRTSSQPERQARSRTSSTSQSVTEHPSAHDQVPQVPHPAPTTHVDFRPMTQIDETREPSRPVTREQTIVKDTARPSSGVDRASPIKKRDMDPSVIAKMAAIELDKKLPQMELPEMACFTMELGEQERNPEEVLAELSQERRQKERKLFIKRLRRMYNLSQSNGAQAKRILSKQDGEEMYEGRMPDLFNPDIGDIIAIDELTEQLDITLGLRPSPPEPPQDPRPWTKHLEARRRRSIVPITEESEESENRMSSASSGKSRARSAEEKTLKTSPKESIHPLSLNGVLGTSGKVVEAKCMSTMWSNYLHAGKSQFAPV